MPVLLSNHHVDNIITICEAPSGLPALWNRYGPGCNFFINPDKEMSGITC